MRVYLTFDIEVWCRSWETLDADFPWAFNRYVFGRSSHGSYALPKTLDILARNDVHGVFFVEPLFAARFGLEYLERIVTLIQEAGQEVQLHLHPEWTDEIRPPLLEDVARKRQHLSYYTQAEQTILIRKGVELLKEAGVEQVSAFRAGSFAANADTYAALSANGIRFDSSLNATSAISAPDIQRERRAFRPCRIGDVSVYPITAFIDGFGRTRHAQVGACSSLELEQMLEGYAANGMEDIVIFSHNFEMLRPSSCEPDFIVARRFERLCQVLGTNGTYTAAGFPVANELRGDRQPASLPRAGLWATSQRYAEQAMRDFRIRIR